MYLCVVDDEGPCWCLHYQYRLSILCAEETYRPNQVSILLIEIIEDPRVEDRPAGGHTGGQIVGFHDGVVSRIELKHDNVADSGGDIMGQVLMGIFFRTDLGGMGCCCGC